MTLTLGCVCMCMCYKPGDRQQSSSAANTPPLGMLQSELISENRCQNMFQLMLAGVQCLVSEYVHSIHIDAIKSTLTCELQRGCTHRCHTIHAHMWIAEMATHTDVIQFMLICELQRGYTQDSIQFMLTCGLQRQPHTQIASNSWSHVDCRVGFALF